MCTALKFKSCIGRNFDYEQSYKEQIIKISENQFENKYAIVGVGTGLETSYPLLYDGMNSEGLVCCGLAFEGNAEYAAPNENMLNIPAYDFVFQILANYNSVEAVRNILLTAVITDEQFSKDFPNSDLHWFIADANEAIIVESTTDGLDCYDAETNVLTNNPPYIKQLDVYTRAKSLIGTFDIWFGDKSENIKNSIYNTRGLETYSLNGSYTSFGRFERASFLIEKMENAKDVPFAYFNDIAQTFHLLGAVEQVWGVTEVADRYEYTIYSIVYNMRTMEVEIKTYDYRNSRAVLFDGEAARYDLFDWWFDDGL